MNKGGTGWKRLGRPLIVALFGLSGAACQAGPPEPGETFRDCKDCPEMTVIPAGTFIMGRETEERSFVNAPAHKVTIGKPLAVGTFEVTWDEWQACVDAGVCNPKAVEAAGGDSGFGRGKRPVINVSWGDAILYVRWLRIKTKQRYRLLTDAEWEYAARAGTQTLFSFGDDPGFKEICKFENTADLSWGSGFSNRNCSDGYGKQTAPVGSFPKNGFGLYDMHGNVAEWVQDCWHPRYDWKGERAPTDGSAWNEPKCILRTHRNGSWALAPKLSVAYFRDFSTYSWRSDRIGFRVARDLEPQ